MKRTVQLLFLFFVFLMFLPFMVSAQEGKTKTITITITEDGKVTTDTTFDLAEGQDPYAIKEIVEELAGEDIHLKMAMEGHKKVIYIKEGEDEDHEFQSEEGKTYVVKVIKEGKGDCEGEKHIKVFIGDDDEVEIIEEGGDLKWIEEDEDGGEVIIIKSDDGREKVIVKKQVKVEIHEEGDDVDKEKEVVVKKKKEKK